MVSHTSSYDKASSLSILQSPISSISTDSQASTSSYPTSSNYTGNPNPQRPNLPTPPPSDRRPPPKGRTGQHQNGGHKLMKSLRKGKERDRQVQSTGDIEEDWTLEGIPPPSSFHGITPKLEGRRASSDTTQTVGSSTSSIREGHGSEIPPKDVIDRKEKKSKGRGIVKKTSRLFSRDKENEKSPEYEQSNGTSSLNPIPTTRQTSYSSAHSSDSHNTTATGHSVKRNNLSQFPSVNRPVSSHSRPKSPNKLKSHSRRASQDSSASSWRARSVRTGSSPHEPYASSDVGVPIPSRRGSSLSASVPGLSRDSLPQPGSTSGTSSSIHPPSVNSRSPDTFPSRMSTWFSHLLPSTSTTTIQEGSSMISPPLSISTTDSPPPLPPSPMRKPPSAAASFLNAARQRAVDGVRHLLDSEAQPDKCPDTIWVMGVGHTGWRPTTPNASSSSVNLPDLQDPAVSSGAVEDRERRGSAESNKLSPPSKNDVGALRPSAWSKKQKEQSATSKANPSSTPPPRGFSNLFTASTLSLALPASISGGSPSKEGSNANESPGKSRKDRKEKEILRWPDQFYDDFRSVVWCTYRSQYAPILSLPNNQLIPSPQAYYSAFGPPADISIEPSSFAATSSGATSGIPTRPSGTGWSWSRSEGGLTSDAGWGCMLRTGQSMLANALVHLHLGRDWRLHSKPSTTLTSPSELADLQRYAEYVKIISWFLDDPSPLCPFSVHRMALIGKELGKEVGEWFGPSTAAGALKTLTNSFAPCGLAVSTATDSIIYKSEVYQASNLSSAGWNIPSLPHQSTKNGRDVPIQRQSSSSTEKSGTVWGDKAVLILVGIRLGLDGVNPIYYESIKELFVFPQSVGIAGGRPSSSYYFVGSQANSLFYLDPHLTRPAVPLETPPAPTGASAPGLSSLQSDADPVVRDSSTTSSEDVKYKLDVVDVDDISSDESNDSDVASSPSTRISKVRKARGTSKQAIRLSAKGTTPPKPQIPATGAEQHQQDDSESPTPRAAATSTSPLPPSVSATSEAPHHAHHPLDTLPVDPEIQWWVNAYPEQALRTFHCEKVKKIPLSGLDPSMLLGFLIRNDDDWADFVERASKLPHKIFSVQDEPPTWDVDSDTELQSVSEPGEPSLDDEEIESVPISSNRQPLLSSVHSQAKKDFEESEKPEEDEDDSFVVSNTTVKAVDIISDKTRKMGINDGDEEEEEEEEEDWTEGGGTPSSQKPVLVEIPTPTTTRQASWPKSNNNNDFTSQREQVETIKPFNNQEGVPFPTTRTPMMIMNDLKSDENKNDDKRKPGIPTALRPRRPLLEEQRMRTGSWVDPSPVRGEAPNGDNLL
ncbi:uncharacterized protein L201_000829 [Kwoniella dendrophila CBS 6074]|uniref:Autophagy-related protein 4 n=1 Tax=Kwoniella dendrophila CBS 6074 TaxID=1295534 RepID=A0AAX4JMF5_9TREE